MYLTGPPQKYHPVCNTDSEEPLVMYLTGPPQVQQGSHY